MRLFDIVADQSIGQSIKCRREEENKKITIFSHLGSGKDVEWNKIEIGNDDIEKERKGRNALPCLSGSL